MKSLLLLLLYGSDCAMVNNYNYTASADERVVLILVSVLCLYENRQVISGDIRKMVEFVSYYCHYR